MKWWPFTQLFAILFRLENRRIHAFDPINCIGRRFVSDHQVDKFVANIAERGQVSFGVVLFIAIYVVNVYGFLVIPNPAHNALAAILSPDLDSAFSVATLNGALSLTLIWRSAFWRTASLCFQSSFSRSMVRKVGQPVLPTKLLRGWLVRHVAHLAQACASALKTFLLFILAQNLQTILAILPTRGKRVGAARAYTSRLSQHLINRIFVKIKPSGDFSTRFKFFVCGDNQVMIASYSFRHNRMIHQDLRTVNMYI